VTCFRLALDRVQWRVSVSTDNLLVLGSHSSFVSRYLPQLDRNGMLALPKRVVSASV
jgi:hypothetical protein